MSELDQYTRWNESHTKAICVAYQEESSWYLREDRAALGVDVITCNPVVAEMFGVEVDDQKDSILKSSILEAIKNGDHVFYIEFGEHSGCWCHLHDDRPQRTWDSGFCGVVVVRRKAWLEAMPGRTFARSYVSQILHESWDREIDAYLNNGFYKAYLEGSEDDDDYTCWSDFITPEEAIKAAQQEYPEIVYSDDDFEEVRLYTLKKQ